MNRLKELRKKLGLSQQELADALSVHQTLISQIERGAVVPSGSLMVELADYFGVSVDYMLGREEADLVPPMMDRAVVDINVYGRILHLVKRDAEAQRE